MVNISIISKCNNNCQYCFQENNYHQLDKMLTYEEFEDILKWAKGSQRVAILGGEPTLHPDIVEILKRSNQEFPTAIFTNLLAEPKTLRQIIRNVHNLSWLVNTTTKDSMKDLFEENIKFLNFSKIKIKAGITFINNPEHDNKYIENLIRLGKQYPDSIQEYRLCIAAPYNNRIVDLSDHSNAILQFCELAKKETPNIKLSYDCTINFCQIPLKTAAQLIDIYNIENIRNSECKMVYDILADKSIKYCSFLPEDIIPAKKYYEFANHKECSEYLYNIKNKFMKEFCNICRIEKNCINEICHGPCFAVTAYLKKMREKGIQIK